MGVLWQVIMDKILKGEPMGEGLKLNKQSTRLLPVKRVVGGGPTLYPASRHPVADVIIESTFGTAFRVVTRIPHADRYVS